MSAIKRRWLGGLIVWLVLFTAYPVAAGTDCPDSAQKSEPLLVIAVGDIMLGTDFPLNHLPDDDGISFFEGVSEILRSADITFGNLEQTLMNGGEPVKTCTDPNVCYLFRSPTRYATHLRNAGFDVMSLANNHAIDFGEEGRDASMAALDEVGILHSGREDSFASWQVNDQKIALMAFAPFKGSSSPLGLIWSDLQRTARADAKKCGETGLNPDEALARGSSATQFDSAIRSEARRAISDLG